jgi:shikimate kinase
MGTGLYVNEARHIVLIGLMGSGKTATGRVLAQLVGRPYVDNDELLERRTGHTARELEEMSGTDSLHDAEVGALVDALQETRPAVVSAAAFAPLRVAVRAALNDHVVVYLRADAEELAARITRDSVDHYRPFPQRDLVELLREQHAQRDACYDEIADFVVETGGHAPREVAELVKQQLDEPRRRRAPREP